MLGYWLERRRRGMWLVVGIPFLMGPFPNLAFALTQAELDAMRDRWNASGSEDYNYFVQRICFCDPEVIRPGLVEVRSGAITSVIDAETLEPLDPQAFLTVEGLFDELQTALLLPAFAIDTQFHNVLGYPTSISIDPEENLADDEVMYMARDLRLVPEPTSVLLAIVGALGVGWIRSHGVSRRRPPPNPHCESPPLLPCGNP